MGKEILTWTLIHRYTDGCIDSPIISNPFLIYQQCYWRDMTLMIVMKYDCTPEILNAEWDLKKLYIFWWMKMDKAIIPEVAHDVIQI
jgi:hypothetical protein